jgi:hypothetical protein
MSNNNAVMLGLVSGRLIRKFAQISSFEKNGQTTASVSRDPNAENTHNASMLYCTITNHHATISVLILVGIDDE